MTTMLLKSFFCSENGCNQSFASKDRLVAHETKHQMTLKLGVKGANYLSEALAVDQTPTPTRFLQYGNQVGLFDELTNPNPFDIDFKAAQKEGSKTRRTNQTFGQISSLNTNKPMHMLALSPVTGGLTPTSFFMPPSLIPSPQPLLQAAHAGFSGGNSPMTLPTNHLLSPTLLPYPGLISVMSDSQRAAAAMFAANVSVASSPTVAINNPFLNNQLGSFSTANPADNNSEEHNNRQAITSVSKKLIKNSEPTITKITNNLSGREERSASAVTTSSVNSDYQKQKDTLPHGYNNSCSPSSSIKSSTGLSLNIPPHGSAQNKLPPPPTVVINNEDNIVTSTINPQFSASSNNFTSEKSLVAQENKMDAKQKLKETLKTNNPRLVKEDSLKATLESESINSSTNNEQALKQDQVQTTKVEALEQQQPTATTGRRRGRQSKDIDPDIKRQRFLERNRAAASRCRNKKKKWVCNLETKAKTLQQTNLVMQTEIAALKDEVATLKQLLLSHRDCPVTKMQQQSMQLSGIKFDLLTQQVVTTQHDEQVTTSTNCQLTHPAIKVEATNVVTPQQQIISQQQHISTNTMYDNKSTISHQHNTNIQNHSSQTNMQAYNTQVDSNAMNPIYSNRACT